VLEAPHVGLSDRLRRDIGVSGTNGPEGFCAVALRGLNISSKADETRRVNALFLERVIQKNKARQKNRAAHKKGWKRLALPAFDAVKRAPQLLQARALATQLQLEPSGLRQAVTLPRARDQRV
jgi:hypothetical protein